ncbi:hypothetical protein C414_000280000 [Campylobacter jejuni subsp. jejuni 414]|nr:hypothetical protein C414_000280000 [Campylobacter jejuni subsp. jejuni 414]
MIFFLGILFEPPRAGIIQRFFIVKPYFLCFILPKFEYNCL